MIQDLALPAAVVLFAAAVYAVWCALTLVVVVP